MSGTPYDSPKAPLNARRTRSPLFTIGKVVLGLAAVVILIGMLLPMVRHAGPAAYRTSCMNNMRQITLAMLNYESANGHLPPAYTVDSEGNRLHSWRTLILPFMEQNDLYKSIDFSKPWDDPANAEARETVIEAYCCPSVVLEDCMTPYCGVFGPDSVFSGSVPRELSEVTDGSSNTIVLLEVDADHAVHWMSPYDVNEDVLLALEPESGMNHEGGMIAAFLDGHMEFLSHDQIRYDLGAMLTIAGDDGLAEEPTEEDAMTQEQ